MGQKTLMHKISRRWAANAVVEENLPCAEKRGAHKHLLTRRSGTAAVGRSGRRYSLSLSTSVLGLKLAQRNLGKDGRS